MAIQAGTGEGINEGAGRGGMLALLRNRNFRLFWVGESISLLGDQFQIIALPWLVLQMTGDALAMGTVLALAGVPRAVFALLGGAMTDRLSPRRVMLASNVVRMALVAGMAGLILFGAPQLWMIYTFALAFGLADAFFYPAQNAIVPRLVGKDDLQLANSLVQGVMQLSLFAGPVLAGIVIAAFSGAGSEASTVGIGAAFAIDAATFLVSAAALWALNEAPIERPDEDQGVFRAIAEGLRLVWDEPVLRTIFILIAAANFLVVGPIDVGVPTLAGTRLPEGARAFGLIMSAFGGGSLIGLALAGGLPRPPQRVLGLVLTVVWSVMGVFLALMGLLASTPPIAAASFFMGVANSYVVITFITWLQLRVPEALMGRVMSLLMFVSVGLLPLSTTISGVVGQWNLVALFVGGGLAMTGIVLALMAPNPRIRRMEVSLPGGE
jgi:hypothetical protein